MSLKSVGLLAAALFVSTSNPAQARPFTAKDLAMIERVGEARLSPDGAWIAYNLRSTDWDGNRSTNSLVLVRSSGGSAGPAVVSNERGGTNPRWAGDGRLYFLSAKTGTAQIWRREHSGALAQVTAFPLDVAGFRLAPDGRSLVAVIDAVPDCADLACTKAANEARDKIKATGQLVGDGARSRYWDGYADDRHLGLFRVTLDGAGAPAEATPLLRGWRADVLDKATPDDGAFAISGDGRTIYFAGQDPEARGNDGAPIHLWLVPADGSSAPKRLRPQATLSDTRPTLSPDGRTLAFVAIERPEAFGSSTPMLIDLRSGRARELAPGRELAVRKLAWSSDGRTVYANADADGQVPLLAIDAARGTLATLVPDGQVGDFDARGSTVSFVRDSMAGPAELYVRRDAAEPRALTSIGAKALAETPLSPYQRFTFAGWNGETVSGYAVKPAGYVEGAKYPVAFLIHGGPHGSFGNAWSYRWNPQVWAGMGYGVVMVDFHGSAGYGEAFGESIIGHWGDRPLEDLQKGLATALTKYDWLDGSRACALGGSYGGYMVNWIAGNWPEPWDCLVNHAGVFDTRVMAYSTDIQKFSETEFAGMSGSSALRFDPSDHVAKWRVPTLVIHGARDFRVPLDQGIATHNALRERGVATELLVYPDENHWVLKPQNSVQWYDVVGKWMARWLKPAAPSTEVAAPPR